MNFKPSNYFKASKKKTEKTATKFANPIGRNLDESLDDSIHHKMGSIKKDKLTEKKRKLLNSAEKKIDLSKTILKRTTQEPSKKFRSSSMRNLHKPKEIEDKKTKKLKSVCVTRKQQSINQKKLVT